MFDGLAGRLVDDLAGFAADDRFGAAPHFFVMDVAKILVPATDVICLMGLAFMMAVTTLSLPEMFILKKVVKVLPLALFAAYLATAFVVVGIKDCIASATIAAVKPAD